MATLVLASMLMLNPEEILARAVSLVEMCGYDEARKFKLNSSHAASQETQHDKEDKDSSQLLSIPQLLRRGRYQLSSGGSWIDDGREYQIVNFFPMPEDMQLKHRKGEDKRFNKAMNHLYGTVLIDRETGGLIDVRADLPAEVSYYAVGKLYEVSFSFKQELIHGRWLPSSLRLEYGGRVPLTPFGIHNLHTVRFNCAQSAKATP
jgi:hypothetical protein